MKLPDFHAASVLLPSFLAEAEGPTSAGVTHDHVQAMDAAACIMIGLLFFLLGCVLYAVWRLSRHSKKASPLDGLESDDTHTHPKSSKKPSSWEKDPDWWKK